MDAMPTFDDLLTTYQSSPDSLLREVQDIEPQARHDLLVQNVGRRLHANRVESEEAIAALPREYRRLTGVRWDHFGYVLHYFTPEMMEHQLRGHLEVEREDAKATYMRNMLAMLVWMATDHAAEDGEVDEEAPKVKKRGGRRG